MSTGSEFDDEPQYPPWAPDDSHSSPYTIATEDTNDSPTIPISTNNEYTPSSAPPRPHLTESDEELLLASEQYEARRVTTENVIPLVDTTMNPFTPVTTLQEFKVAHTFSLEDWAYNTILSTNDPALRQLWHYEAPILEMIIFYITNNAPHSTTLSGNPHNAWPWYHTEWMSATFLLQQLRHRVTTYYPHVWSWPHRTELTLNDFIALEEANTLNDFIALEEANTTTPATDSV